MLKITLVQRIESTTTPLNWLTTKQEIQATNRHVPNPARSHSNSGRWMDISMQKNYREEIADQRTEFRKAKVRRHQNIAAYQLSHKRNIRGKIVLCQLLPWVVRSPASHETDIKSMIYRLNLGFGLEAKQYTAPASQLNVIAPIFYGVAKNTEEWSSGCWSLERRNRWDDTR